MIIDARSCVTGMLPDDKISIINDKQILIGAAVFFLCLFPMSYGLYTQFGFHGLIVNSLLKHLQGSVDAETLVNAGGVTGVENRCK